MNTVRQWRPRGCRCGAGCWCAEECDPVGFTVSGTAGLSVEVATGNAEFTDQLMSLPVVTSDVPVALAWNSSVVGASLPSAVTGGTGSRSVITGFDQRLIVNADSSITYYGPGGPTGVVTPSHSVFV